MPTYQVEDKVLFSLQSRNNGLADGNEEQAQEVKFIQDLFHNNKSPFHYSVEKREDYQKVEADIFDRPPDFLNEPKR
jgi:hypothetical protein